MTLDEFLLARIAEDERAAKAVPPLGYVHDMGGRRHDERLYVTRLSYSSLDGRASGEQDLKATALFARHDPARVLAECAAKRAIVDSRATFEQGRVTEREIGMKLTMGGCVAGIDVALKFLALPHADHPDYDEAWRP